MYVQREPGKTKECEVGPKRGGTCNTPPCTRTMTPIAGKSFLAEVQIASRLFNEQNVCFRAAKHLKGSQMWLYNKGKTLLTNFTYLILDTILLSEKI